MDFILFLPHDKQESSDLSNLESKWDSVESKRTPDLDQMDIEQYQVGHLFSVYCLCSLYGQ